MTRLFPAILGLSVAFFAVGCGRSEAPAQPSSSPSAATTHSSLRIVVSIPPLAWIVHELTKSPTGVWKGVEITQIVPAGVGCEGVELTPAQVVAIDKADVIVITGLGLEPQIEKAMERSDRASRRVASFRTARGVVGSLIRTSDAHAHDHDHDHDHDHGHDHGDSEFDPHAWLDPELMIALAMQVADQMRAAIGQSKLDAPNREIAFEELQSGMDRIRAACIAIDDEYRQRLASAGTRDIVTEHNGYAYLAHRYGLKVVAVIRPLHEVEPAPADIEAAAKAVAEQNVKAIFVEPQYSQAGARRIAEITGARVMVLDALGDGDWPAMMRRNINALVQGLGTKKEASE